MQSNFGAVPIHPDPDRFSQRSSFSIKALTFRGYPSVLAMGEAKSVLKVKPCSGSFDVGYILH